MNQTKFAIVAVLLSSTILSSPLCAQFGGGGGNNGGFGGFGGAGGIVIDAEGIVKTSPPKRISKTALKRLQQEFSKEHLSAEVLQQSTARTLSLKQLDQAVKQALDSGEPFPASLRFLAGLQRIDYFVIDRERNDLFIVGPAEGFGPGPIGRIVGTTTGRPPMQLDDLVVALRSTFGGQRAMGVSIDPTKENMSKLQNYIRQNSNATTSSRAQKRFQMMGRILDKQVISFWGIPEDSHFASILLEADLRMKGIALGTDNPGVRGIRSHLSLLRPQGNSLQRWWFTSFYEPIGTNEDRTVFEIKGQRAQVMAQEEQSGPDGEREDSAFTRLSTQKFAQLFTEHFEDLARVNPAFAELQSLYDLSLVSVLMRNESRQGNQKVDLETLLNDDRLPLGSYPVPKFVPSKSTFRKSSRGMLIGLIGGVTIDVNRAVNNIETRPGLGGKKFQQSSLAPGWWNAGSLTTKDSAIESRPPRN